MRAARPYIHIYMFGIDIHTIVLQQFTNHSHKATFACLNEDCAIRHSYCIHIQTFVHQQLANHRHLSHRNRQEERCATFSIYCIHILIHILVHQQLSNQIHIGTTAKEALMRAVWPRFYLGHSHPHSCGVNNSRTTSA
jgi:hypothetical protein